jgi:hypothetical protein
MLVVHSLAADVRDLLAGDGGQLVEVWDGLPKRIDIEGTRLIAVRNATRLGPGDGPGGSENVNLGAAVRCSDLPLSAQEWKSSALKCSPESGRYHLRGHVTVGLRLVRQENGQNSSHGKRYLAR